VRKALIYLHTRNPKRSIHEKKVKTAISHSLLICIMALSTVAGFAAEPDKASASNTRSSFDILTGKWVRPDGGYTITITGVATNGNLEASYANPSLLPFSKAVASRDGKTIKVFLELKAGGYNGSTYTRTYDPGQDILKGVYFQAVAQQKYDIYFARVKP
jgi:uncharacterized protein (DUF2147 family)